MRSFILATCAVLLMSMVQACPLHVPCTSQTLSVEDPTRAVGLPFSHDAACPGPPLLFGHVVKTLDADGSAVVGAGNPTSILLLDTTILSYDALGNTLGTISPGPVIVGPAPTILNLAGLPVGTSYGIAGVVNGIATWAPLEVSSFPTTATPTTLATAATQGGSCTPQTPPFDADHHAHQIWGNDVVTRSETPSDGGLKSTIRTPGGYADGRVGNAVWPGGVVNGTPANLTVEVTASASGTMGAHRMRTGYPAGTQGQGESAVSANVDFLEFHNGAVVVIAAMPFARLSSWANTDAPFHGTATGTLTLHPQSQGYVYLAVFWNEAAAGASDSSINTWGEISSNAETVKWC
ncbi:MAG TPA: hypothetical protein VM327_05125 [Candidatus Thermoplasmatota archaeon]|nr:hypothetical protein [Candidatus Thermoplasmatota archaeon]